MIDTDEYEGHTAAPWELITNYSEENWDNKWVGSVHLFTTLGISFDVVGVNETDVQLMADAPLLLAEVKRLREVNDDLICDFEGFQEAVKEDEAGYKDLVASLEGIEEELKAEVKRLRSGMQDILDDFETTKTDMWSIIKRIQELIE